MNLSGQDWETVTFRKKRPDTAKETIPLPRAPPTTSTVLNKPAYKIEQNAQEGNFSIPLVSSEDAKFITAERVKRKLTRAQLAQKVRMKEAQIADIENRKAPENKAHISSIKKALAATPIPPS